MDRAQNSSWRDHRQRTAEEIGRALGGRRSGRGWRCRCPAHRPDGHPSFTVVEKDGKVLFKCWSGCSQLQLVSALRGMGLWGGQLSSDYAAPRKTSDSGPEASRGPHDPMKPWRQTGPLTSECVPNRYLRNRIGEITDAEARSLRFSPSMWHWPSDSNWPCLIARVSHATGEDLGSHMTFIACDRNAKAPIEKPRLFSAGTRSQGGGVWFGTIDSHREFIICEGLESVLSAMRIFGVTGGCAALSANGIRNLILPPEAKLIRIFADHDGLGQGLSAAREAGRRWTAEGRAVAISMALQVGQDANDIWMKRQRP
jgi:putative DNA primase/helicase